MKVYLHAGLGKTGTSYMQAALAHSIDNLDAQGVYYPMRSGVLERALRGETTSGNCVPNLRDLTKRINGANRLKRDRILISNEAFMKRLTKDFFIDQVIEKSKFPLEFKVLLFVRNPFDHAILTYHQFVKGKGYSKTFERFVQSYRGPAAAAEFIHLINANAQTEITVLNYDRTRNALLDRLGDFLELESGSLAEPPRGVINRSLTRAELRLLTALNQQIGPDARVVTNALCEGTPDIQSEPPEASESCIREFHDRMVIETDRLNAILPEDQAIDLPGVDAVLERFEAAKSVRGKRIHFNEDQLNALAHGVANLVQQKVAEVEPETAMDDAVLAQVDMIAAAVGKLSDTLAGRDGDAEHAGDGAEIIVDATPIAAAATTDPIEIETPQEEALTAHEDSRSLDEDDTDWSQPDFDQIEEDIVIPSFGDEAIDGLTAAEEEEYDVELPSLEEDMYLPGDKDGN